jgi:hypothetical protein|tara:strand:+ start:74 stop:766 length:693 start_codon:yes stop_codon:yes gene_type:complete
MAYSKIIHTKSEAPDVVPQPSSLTFGELAINYFDGKAYIKNTNNLVAKIGDTAYESRIGQLERDAAVAQNTIDKVALTFENAGITQHPLTFNNPHFVTSAQLLKYVGGVPGTLGTYSIHDLTWVPNTEALLFNSPEFTGTPLAPTASQATTTTQIATTAFAKTAVADLRGQIDSTAGKADKSITYTKTEVDNLLDTKPSSTSYDNIVQLTQTAYNNITTPVSTTLYIIVG